MNSGKKCEASRSTCVRARVSIYIESQMQRGDIFVIKEMQAKNAKFLCSEFSEILKSSLLYKNNTDYDNLQRPGSEHLQSWNRR